jgi:replicative DNA helicase
LVAELVKTGASAAHYVRYGQMVREMSFRRQVEMLGVRMEQVAASEQTAVGDLGTWRATREAMLQQLADFVRQVQRADGATFGRIENSPGIMPVPPPSAPLPARLVARAERHLVHAVIADAQWRDSGLLDRLRPDDFTSPAHANTWKAVQTLVECKEPVDPVLVAWQAEVQVAGLPSSGPARQAALLDAAELDGMAATPDGDTVRMIAVVTRSALTRLATQAREQIQQTAGDRGLTTRQVIATVEKALTGLDEQAARLTGPAPAAVPTALQSRLAGGRTHSEPAQNTPRTR